LRHVRGDGASRNSLRKGTATKHLLSMYFFGKVAASAYTKPLKL
jgi:hypothetical protein